MCKLVVKVKGSLSRWFFFQLSIIKGFTCETFSALFFESPWCFFLVDDRRGDTTKLRVRMILFSRNGRSFKMEDLPASHHLILALRMLFGVCGRKHGVLHPLLFHAFVAGVGGIFHIILPPKKQSNSAGWHWMDGCAGQ